MWFTFKRLGFGGQLGGKFDGVPAKENGFTEKKITAIKWNPKRSVNDRDRFTLDKRENKPYPLRAGIEGEGPKSAIC